MDGSTTTEKLAPKRTVGFWGNALFQLNGMIGSGIFALPAVLVAAVGSFAPMMMLIGGVIFLPLVLVFAWLARRYDGTGGPILYGKTAFGDFAGFQAGWGRYASGMVAMAANTHVMIAYFAAIFPALEDVTVATVVVVLTILAFTVINLFSMRQSVNTLGGLTVLKLVPLVILIAAAVFGQFTSPGIVLPQFSEVESIVLILFYAFIGFEGVTVPAGESTNPKRDIPRVLVTVLAGVTVLYAIIIWAYLTIAPAQDENISALASAAQVALGDWGALMIVLCAGFSIAANSFGGLIIVPRMAYGMAEQKMLPAWFEKVHPRFLTPFNSIAFYGIFSAAFAVWDGFVALAAASTLCRLLTYCITAAALPVIEKREGMLNPLHAVVAVLAFAASVWIASHANADAWQMFGTLVLVGTGLYFIARRRDAATA
ncbi:APC family permease [Aurantiacibacter gangjinensis]|uniref:Arginine/agmatine antiporter n=1 Tax=Aurantiacibacter gangjinensis TaxID=502682 RepID=A0A0G9MRE9_9SPHN|nr:APC family permease [Aurantiacibacter gangjinensis]APE29235.1 Amino acid permease [Aurantiacibacter gangjinensis]KLE33290.1 cationic amino acid transporter [Aurantiacibacter gangjinensis]